jgi:serine/threonine protein kinase
VGTPDFLAPEAIVAPGQVRSESDVYSLGCTLYYAVTGKVPFPGGATSEKLRRHLEEAPLTPARLNPQLDPQFVDLIADMMHKRLSERLGSADEVVRRLRPWTVDADENTWRQLGQYAAEPGERSLSGSTIDDTLPVESDGMDTNHRGERSVEALPLAPVVTAAGGATPSGIMLAAPAGMPAVERQRPFEFAGLGAGAMALVVAAVVTAIAAMALVVMSLMG